MPPGEQGSVRGKMLESGEPVIKDGELKRARAWKAVLKFMLDVLKGIHKTTVGGTDDQRAARPALL